MSLFFPEGLEFCPVPMKEKIPAELAKTIATKGISAAPTLVMLKTFAHREKTVTK